MGEDFVQLVGVKESFLEEVMLEFGRVVGVYIINKFMKCNVKYFMREVKGRMWFIRGKMINFNWGILMDFIGR